MKTQMSNPWDNEYLKKQQAPIYEPLWVILQKFLNNHLEEKTVLDYGCGDGNYSVLINDLGFNVLGIDISSNAIKMAKRSIHSDSISFQSASSIPENIPDDSFDIVVMLNVLHCISNKDRICLLQNIRRVLKNNGFLFVSVLSIADESFPRDTWQEIEPNTFNDGRDKLFHFFTLDEIKSELEGLDIIQSEILENIHPDLGKKSSLYLIIAQNKK